MAIWRRVACWILKLRARAHTHTDQHVILVLCFHSNNRFSERASILRYSCISCLVSFKYSRHVYFARCPSPRLPLQPNDGVVFQLIIIVIIMYCSSFLTVLEAAF